MKKLFPLMLFFCFSCTTKARDDIHVSLVDNAAVKITGFDNAIMQELNHNPANNWENLFAFYAVPADTDLKDYQPVLHGTYRINGNALLFTPDTPFSKHKTYFLRHYLYNSDKSTFNYLKRKEKIGRTRYTDLIFKP